MERMDKLHKVIGLELDKIAEKGLNTANLDTAYKLVDMYKDLKNTEYWEIKSDYYDYVLAEMQGGSEHGGYAMSEEERAMYGKRHGETERMSKSMKHDYHMGAGHDPMYDRYMSSKMSYRTDKSMDGKKRLMDSLEDYMDDFTEKIREMHRDADTPEEREMIAKFMSKLQNIR